MNCTHPRLRGSARCHLPGYVVGPEGLADLVGGSGLSLDVVCLAGIRYIGTDGVRRLTGLTRPGPGYLIPYPELVAGCAVLQPEPQYWRIKLKSAIKLKSSDKKGARYLAPKGIPPRLYVPPLPPFTGLDWPEEVWVTEGEKKALKATQDGLPTLGLAGVWAWKSKGGPAIPDLERVPWRKVTLIYDSDIGTRHPAYPAYQRLAGVLQDLGAAEVRIVAVPDVA